MTVKELYEKLKLEIDAGHGNVLVMIHDYVKDEGYCGYTEVNDLRSTLYFEETSYWPEQVEIGRY